MNQNSTILGGVGLQNKQQMNTSAGLFGANSQTNQMGGLFGSSNQQSNTNKMGMGNQLFDGGFNKPAGFGAQTTSTVNMNIQGTYSIRYQVTAVDEPSFNKQAGGAQKPIPIRLISISAMNEFAHKSLEELRIEDYRIKKNGMIPPIQNAPTGMGIMGSQFFGAANQSLFGQQQNNQQQSTGLGSQQNQQQGSSLFGTNNQNSSLFANPQQQTQAPAQQGGFGLFGSNSVNNLGLGLSANAQQGGLFGQQNPQAISLFGANKPAGQNQIQGTSIFGNQNQSNQLNQQQGQENKGGLFGNLGLGQAQQHPQQQTGGLFSSSTQPQSGLGSGLFGQTTQQPQQTGGLFGQNVQQQQSAGLFGAQNSGGLFVAPAQKPAGSLFGGVSNAQNTGTSIFGAPVGASQQQSSLFGGNASFNLFGGQNQQAAGLSFDGIQTAAKPASNLFCAPNQQSTSLFGGQSGTNSLFGATGAQSQLGQQNSSLFADNAQKGGLFASACAAQPSGLNLMMQNQTILQAARPTNAYLDLINVGKKSIEEVLEDIQKDYLEAQFDNSFKKIQSKSSNIYNEEFKRFYPEMMPFDLCNKYPDYHNYKTEPEKYDFYKNRDLSYADSFLKSKRNVSYGKRFDLLESSPESRKPNSNNINIFKQMQLNKEREMMNHLHIDPEDLDKNYRNLEKLRYNIYRENSKKLSDFYDNSYKTHDLRKNQSVDFAQRDESSQILNNIEFQVGNLLLERKSDLNNLNDFIEINVILQDPIKYITKIKINKNKPVKLLKKSIADELCEKNPPMFRKIKEDSFLLMKNFAIIRDENTIQAAKLQDGDTVYILLHEKFEQFKIKEDSSSKLNRKESNISNANDSKKKKSAVKVRENKELKSELAPIDKLPKLERKGYYTIPSYSEICRMSLKELENIENFTIFNEFGKIVFEGFTDLTELNIDQIVNISEREITLYRNGRDKITPEIGKGLNKPANIYMFKLYPENVCEDDYDDKEDYPKLLSCLEDLCCSMGVI